MPIIYKNGNIYGGASSADDVSFDDTPSGLSATNVQDAIDEVVERVWEGTLAQYNAIPVKDPNTVYYVTDASPVNIGLNNLSDVTISSPSAYQVLMRNSDNSGWENITPLSAVSSNSDNVVKSSAIYTALAYKMDSSNRNSGYGGTIQNLVTSGNCWLICAMAQNSNAGCVLLASNAKGTIYTYEVSLSTGMAYTIDSNGTVTVTYNGSSGVYLCGYRL